MTVSNYMTYSNDSKNDVSEHSKTEIYYFSGTGNSLYVAKQLNRVLSHSKLIPIAAILGKINTDEKTLKVKINAEKVGFVFPCHGLTIPVPVEKILRRLDLLSTNYIFAVVTRGGTIFRGFSKMNKILKQQGRHLDSSFIINMGMNDPKLRSFYLPSAQEFNRIEEGVQEKINSIQEVLKFQRAHHDNIDGVTFSRYKILNFILEKLVPFAVHRFAPKVRNYFYVESSCTGCGICEKVCPSQKIRIFDGKPSWNSKVDCYLCYSCLNFCPNHAIQIYSKFYMKSYTKDNGRYPHPYARVNDIANQKILK